MRCFTPLPPVHENTPYWLLLQRHLLDPDFGYDLASPVATSEAAAFLNAHSLPRIPLSIIDPASDNLRRRVKNENPSSKRVALTLIGPLPFPGMSAPGLMSERGSPRTVYTIRGRQEKITRDVADQCLWLGSR